VLVRSVAGRCDALVRRLLVDALDQDATVLVGAPVAARLPCGLCDHAAIRRQRDRSAPGAITAPAASNSPPSLGSDAVEGAPSRGSEASARGRTGLPVLVPGESGRPRLRAPAFNAGLRQIARLHRSTERLWGRRPRALHDGNFARDKPSNQLRCTRWRVQRRVTNAGRKRSLAPRTTWRAALPYDRDAAVGSLARHRLRREDSP
jgi:hypothetical protein